MSKGKNGVVKYIKYRKRVMYVNPLVRGFSFCGEQRLTFLLIFCSFRSFLLVSKLITAGQRAFFEMSKSEQDLFSQLRRRNCRVRAPLDQRIWKSSLANK